MFKLPLSALALASVCVVSNSFASPYAGAVAGYLPGVGFIPGYVHPAVALGEPTRMDSFFMPIDPFYAPWETNHVVSVGAGGSLTVQFDTPITDDPSHRFGLDFLIFGNNFFTITNGDFTGGGITDGALFSNDASSTRVLVSEDGVTFYELNAALAPLVDGLYPTDAQGDFQRPVNPSLTSASFAGLGLSGIRALYDGSGGGAGYDLAWARDAQGQSVNLSGARFVRVEVLAGHAEIDAFALVPEPATWALAGLAAALTWGARRRLKRDRASASVEKLHAR